MAITSTGNTSLDTITSAYQSNQNEKTETAEDLGKEDFLTMLVAQLQNQDPLSPMEGTDFSAQLAQFSSLEQLMNLNDSMDSLASSFSNDSEGDMLGYMGKQVTGTVGWSLADFSVYQKMQTLLSMLLMIQVKPSKPFMRGQNPMVLTLSIGTVLMRAAMPWRTGLINIRFLLMMVQGIRSCPRRLQVRLKELRTAMKNHIWWSREF
jgi:hypothetical protein